MLLKESLWWAISMGRARKDLFLKIKLGVQNDISSSLSGQQGSYLIYLISYIFLHLYFILHGESRLSMSLK